MYLYFGKVLFCCRFFWFGGLGLFFSFKREVNLQVFVCCNCFVFLKKEFYKPKLCNLVYSLTNLVILIVTFTG